MTTEAKRRRAAQAAEARKKLEGGWAQPTQEPKPAPVNTSLENQVVQKIAKDLMDDFRK